MMLTLLTTTGMLRSSGNMVMVMTAEVMMMTTAMTTMIFCNGRWHQQPVHVQGGEGEGGRGGGQWEEGGASKSYTGVRLINCHQILSFS